MDTERRPEQRDAAARRFVRFGLAGGSAAAVNWVAGRLLSAALVIDLAVVLAYLAGMATAFVLNRVFVFEASGRSPLSDGWRFAAVNLLSLFIVWAVTISLARIVFPAFGFEGPAAEPVAHALGIAAPIVPSYLLHRNFSFARRESQP